MFKDFILNICKGAKRLLLPTLTHPLATDLTFKWHLVYNASVFLQSMLAHHSHVSTRLLLVIKEMQTSSLCEVKQLLLFGCEMAAVLLDSNFTPNNSKLGIFPLFFFNTLVLYLKWGSVNQNICTVTGFSVPNKILKCYQNQCTKLL